MSDEFKPNVLMGNLDWNKAHMWGRLFRAIDDDREGGLDLNATTTGILVGDQGSGKSATLGAILESFCAHIPGGNHLVEGKEGCALAFHYSDNMGYAPELTLINKPNSNPKELELLKPWGITPTGVKKVKILCPPDQIKARKEDYPHLEIIPLRFHESEVSVQSYMQLLGDAESNSFEMERLLELMRRNRNDLRPDRLIEAIHSDHLLESRQKNMLEAKVEKASVWITKERHLKPIFEPGSVIIVDLRDEFLDKRNAFRLMLCLLNIFAEVKLPDGSIFPKILAADEAHEYADDEFLVRSLVRRVRLMRHMSLTILLASQDPPSLHAKLKEMCSWTFMLNQANVNWVADMVQAKSQIGRIAPELFCGLPPGHAWVWARHATDPAYMDKPQKVIVRVRASQHGGFTKSAVN